MKSEPRDHLTFAVKPASLHRGQTGAGPFYIYNAALAAASPALLGWYLWRVLGSGKSKKGWMERLGWPSPNQHLLRPNENIWLHAVSVGEVAAAAPVLKEYHKQPGAFDCGITTITSTGRQMAERLLPEAKAFFLPVDILPAVRAVIRRVRPLCLALCEVELWPNLLNEAKRSGAGVAMVNGRVSDSAMEKLGKFRITFQWALGNIDDFLMQSEEDAERIVTLGADPDRVNIAGNTKFDEADQPLSEDETALLALSYGLDGTCPIFVAGSTNPGEDEVALDAFLTARTAEPALRLIIAPRQIERSDEICELAAARGLSTVRRSDVNGPHKADVLVLNTLGELAKSYALARVAFVGGTFIDKGGHNILQPLAQGVPVVFGPYDYKIRSISGMASQACVAFRTQTPMEMAEKVKELAVGGQRAEYRKKALAFVSSNRGASLRCASAMQTLALAAKAQRN